MGEQMTRKLAERAERMRVTFHLKGDHDGQRIMEAALRSLPSGDAAWESGEKKGVDKPDYWMVRAELNGREVTETFFDTREEAERYQRDHGGSVSGVDTTRKIPAASQSAGKEG